MLALELIAALVFAAVHVLSPKLAFLDRVPRSRWLSAAGGVSIAYVFVHLLPELATHQAEVFASERQEAAEAELFLVALAGLVSFYGLERLVTRHRGGKSPDDAEASPGVFWLHITSFALYNAQIGYLLVHREASDAGALLAYVFAMGLHFLVNDRGLDQHHARRYRSQGRWVLAGAVLLGLGLGYLVTLPDLALSLLFAFLAGGVVLNVLKEELPEERESRFWALALGAAVYALILRWVR